jgi:predicted O-methyltransferase YrrM
MTTPEINYYIENHTTAEDDFLYELNRLTHLRTFYPNMLSGRVQGKFLEMLMHMLKPGRVLEIGTFTGYSAVAMAKALDSGALLYTLENNEELESFLTETLSKSGQGDKIKLIMGDALQIIPRLNETFDFVFIDADKEQYLDYYNAVFPKVKNGGFILADNVLWGGKAAAEIKNPDKETKGIRAFNDFVMNDDRVEQVMLTIRDGLLLMRKVKG